MVVVFVLAALSGSARAATIAGRVTLPDGRPLMERFVYGNAIYGETAHAYDYLGTRDNGYYTLENLPVGTYAVAVVDPWFVRAQIVTNVQVASAGGTYTVDFPLRATYYSPDDNWPGGDSWRWVCGEYLSRCGSDYAQSFVATGPYVVRATIRNCEWGANKEIEVSICGGGPAGAQIGPSRRVRSGAGHGEAAWAAGEVPVTPGRRLLALHGGVALYAISRATAVGPSIRAALSTGVAAGRQPAEDRCVAGAVPGQNGADGDAGLRGGGECPRLDPAAASPVRSNTMGYTAIGFESWHSPSVIPWRGYWALVIQPGLELIVP